MSKRQKITPEFRAEAVELAISTDKSLVEVSESLGINERTQGTWVRALSAEYPESEAQKRGPVQWGQHEKLRRELAEVKRENEFLKDVSAYFASKGKKISAIFGFIKDHREQYPVNWMCDG